MVKEKNQNYSKELDKKECKIVELEKELEKKDLKIAELEKENNGLELEIEELKRKITQFEKDSSTSSKPPSTDLVKVIKNQSLRKQSGKKPGGQEGQKRVGISQSPTPDKIVVCEMSHCACCGKSLEHISGNIQAKRQEKDIPPIQVFVTEYQQIEKICTCGQRNVGEFPDNINAPVQIGNNAKSFMVYLNVAHLIPYKRLCTIAEDLFGFPISEGSIENILKVSGEKAKLVREEIMKMVKTGSWVGSDETGMRVMSKTNWLWTWQNKLGSYFAIEASRRYTVIEKHFGKDYKGISVHDCLSAQNNTKAKAGHQQCHSHLQRDLEFLIKKYNSKWAYDLQKLLYASQKARERIWQKGFDTELRNRIIESYEKNLVELLEVKLLKKEVVTFQKRIRKHQREIFFFMYTAEVPFHNNDSERAIRQAKVKQKISGCFRSREGADCYAMILSVIETAKKHGRNILETIIQLLDYSLFFNHCS